MRTKILLSAVCLLGVAGSIQAQTAVSQNAPPPKLFAGAGDVTALIAKAKAERKPDQANFSQPIVRLAPYSANLEYRVPGLNANPTVHEKEAEVFYVVEGGGTLVTGGKLTDEKRTNPTNLSGTAIEGGERKHVAKGDFFIVPENTPHWLTDLDSVLVVMTLHVPR